MMITPESPGPEPLAEILSRLFTARGLGQDQGRLRLENAWKEAIGPGSVDRTQLGPLRRGVLEVLVRDAVLMHELAQFKKRQLLASLARSLGPDRVKELRFRLGGW
jgi:predicted nucleic acid-binding Zn ribbon protein